MVVRGSGTVGFVLMLGAHFVEMDAGIFEVQLHGMRVRAVPELDMTMVMQAQHLSGQQRRDAKRDDQATEGAGPAHGREMLAGFSRTGSRSGTAG